MDRVDGDHPDVDAEAAREAAARRRDPGLEYRDGIESPWTCPARGVGGDRGHERRVDPAGQPDDCVGEAVLGQVVPGPEDEGLVDLGGCSER